MFPGEVLFTLVPNGSGKTTLIKLIANLLAPTGGRILVHGLDATRSPLPVKRRLGYITCNVSSFYGRHLAVFSYAIHKAKRLGTLSQF